MIHGMYHGSGAIFINQYNVVIAFVCLFGCTHNYDRIKKGKNWTDIEKSNVVKRSQVSTTTLSQFQ